MKDLTRKYPSVEFSHRMTLASHSLLNSVQLSPFGSWVLLTVCAQKCELGHCRS